MGQKKRFQVKLPSVSQPQGVRGVGLSHGIYGDVYDARDRFPVCGYAGVSINCVKEKKNKTWQYF